MKYRKVFIISMILFVVDLLLVLTGYIGIVDNFIYQLIMKLKCVSITNIFIIISFLASTKFIIIVNLIIMLVMIINKNHKLFIVPASSIMSAIVNNLLKFLIGRKRPNIFMLVSEKFYSFPSGHSMIAVLCYGSIVYLINESQIKYKGVWNAIIISFIILVGISRIYLGVHYFSDVIGGYLLAICVLIFLINLKEVKNESINNRSK